MVRLSVSDPPLSGGSVAVGCLAPVSMVGAEDESALQAVTRSARAVRKMAPAVRDT
jgi:hypothetical protein